MTDLAPLGIVLFVLAMIGWAYWPLLQRQMRGPRR